MLGHWLKMFFEHLVQAKYICRLKSVWDLSSRYKIPSGPTWVLEWGLFFPALYQWSPSMGQAERGGSKAGNMEVPYGKDRLGNTTISSITAAAWDDHKTKETHSVTSEQELSYGNEHPGLQSSPSAVPLLHTVWDASVGAASRARAKYKLDY